MTESFGAPRDPAVLNSDEKLFAMLSHLSFFFGGIILPIIFWAVNKDKSKFAVFHSLQALWFHIAVIALFVILIIVFVFGGIGLGILTADRGGKSMPVAFIIAMVIFYCLLFIVGIGAMIYSIVMSIKSYKGEYAKYPFIGHLVFKKIYGKAS